LLRVLRTQHQSDWRSRMIEDIVPYVTVFFHVGSCLLGGRNFAVVPLSIDRGGRETVAKFYAEIGIRELPVYTDTSGEALRALGAVGLPTTLVLDRAGKEIARIVGPAEWDAPEVVEFLKAIIAKQAVQLYTSRAGRA
jgi:hypothetical protein